MLEIRRSGGVWERTFQLFTLMNTRTHSAVGPDNAPVPTNKSIGPAGGGLTRRAALGGLKLNTQGTPALPAATDDEPEVCSHPTPLRQYDTVDLPQPPYTRKFSLASSRALALSQHLVPSTLEGLEEVLTPLAPPSPVKPLESTKRSLDDDIFPYDLALLSSNSFGSRSGGGGGGGGDLGVGGGMGATPFEEDEASTFLKSLDLGPFTE
jgi:hypothetical protein